MVGAPKIEAKPHMLYERYGVEDLDATIELIVDGMQW